jgi:hypothetical protein
VHDEVAYFTGLLGAASPGSKLLTACWDVERVAHGQTVFHRDMPCGFSVGGRRNMPWKRVSINARKARLDYTVIHHREVRENAHTWDTYYRPCPLYDHLVSAYPKLNLYLFLGQTSIDNTVISSGAKMYKNNFARVLRMGGAAEGVSCSGDGGAGDLRGAHEQWVGVKMG